MFANQNKNRKEKTTPPRLPLPVWQEKQSTTTLMREHQALLDDNNKNIENTVKNCIAKIKEKIVAVTTLSDFSVLLDEMHKAIKLFQANYFLDIKLLDELHVLSDQVIAVNDRENFKKPYAYILRLLALELKANRKDKSEKQDIGIFQNIEDKYQEAIQKFPKSDIASKYYKYYEDFVRPKYFVKLGQQLIDVRQVKSDGTALPPLPTSAMTELMLLNNPIFKNPNHPGVGRGAPINKSPDTHPKKPTLG